MTTGHPSDPVAVAAAAGRTAPRSRFGLWAGALFTMLLLTACRESPAVLPPAASTSSIATPTTMPQSTTSVPAGFDGCPDGDPMVADGRLLETQTFSADAARISGITWASVDGCHTVTITFTTEDGAPATTPPSFVARLLRDTGVLRIETGATDSVVADQVVEHGPIDRLFVPVDDAGLRFIDLVLDRPVVARASLLSSPARVEIEIHEGGPNDMGKPLIDRRVVIVAPGPGSQSGTVLDVAGYTSGDATTLTFDVLSNQTVITSQDLDIEPAPRQWRAFAVSIQVGSSYNGLQIRDAGGTVIAGIPLNP